MPFRKYDHVERLSSDEIDGLLIGSCYIQPKIDGANCSAWFDETGIGVASHTQFMGTLDTVSDDALMGFGGWTKANREKFEKYFALHPTYTLYAEWLVPHSLKTYRKDAWRNMYVYDVLDNATGKYIPFDDYKVDVEGVGFVLIPVLAILKNATEMDIRQYLEKNTYLIEDNCGVGEGVVIKNYAYENRFGRQPWGKIVRNEFKEQNLAAFGAGITEYVSTESKFAQLYITEGRLEKVKAKMRETGEMGSKRIGEYFERTWNDVFVELWDYCKKEKNPTIDFRNLNQHVVAKIKELDTDFPNIK
jgi:hypothetical protein